VTDYWVKCNSCAGKGYTQTSVPLSDAPKTIRDLADSEETEFAVKEDVCTSCNGLGQVRPSPY
jgi:DnaJ-class molecular chaperone